MSYTIAIAGKGGTGKTTIARLLAKALNCQKRAKNGLPAGQAGDPCDDCDSCLGISQGRSFDMVEIDAASNRGIDDIRSIKDSAGVAALGGGHKIFIIDEVHMLTPPAFNALLKVLEEPPAHVVFILATTDPQKILATVLSRVQRFDFKRLSAKQVLEKLKEIAGLEKINIDEESLVSIAVSSDGALRDAEVALSKIQSISQGRKVTVEEAADLLGLVPFNYHPEFLGYLVNNDQPSALNFINKIYNSGIDLDNFTGSFINYLRRILIFKVNPATLAAVGEELIDSEAKLISSFSGAIEPKKLVSMLNVFISARENIKSSPIPQLPLELAVLDLTS